MTHKERKKIYLKAVKHVSRIFPYRGLCNSIRKVNPLKYTDKNNYPELYMFYPIHMLHKRHNIPNSSAVLWWNLNEEGFNERLLALAFMSNIPRSMVTKN